MTILPFSAFAQNAYHDWAIGLGGSFIKYKEKSYIPSGQIWASRRFNETLNFNTYFLYSHRITFPFSIDSENGGKEAPLFDGGFLFQVNSNNGIFLKEKARFSPFLQAGLGGNYVPQNSDIYFQMGAGLKLRISNRWEMWAGATKKYSLNKTPEHSTLYLNLLYCFGKGGPLVYPDYVWTYPNRNRQDSSVSISELDMPPKSGDAKKDELAERIWVMQSSLFTDKEKLAILRQDNGRLRDSVRRVADSLAAFQYIGSLDSLYASWDGLASLKNYLMAIADSVPSVGERSIDLTVIDTAHTKQEVSSLDSLKLPLPLQTDIEPPKPKQNDSLPDQLLNCYDLRGRIFWTDFLLNSEESDSLAEIQIQKIAEYLSKCKVLTVDIFALEGNLEQKDPLVSERRRDFVRLFLHFEHKVEKIRIIDVAEPSEAQRELIRTSLLSPSEAGRVYIIFK
ncbi:MAG: hypothetical protein ACKVTZ_17170 [Bacteroidia bacterium]